MLRYPVIPAYGDGINPISTLHHQWTRGPLRFLKRLRQGLPRPCVVVPEQAVHWWWLQGKGKPTSCAHNAGIADIQYRKQYTVYNHRAIRDSEPRCIAIPLIRTGRRGTYEHHRPERCFGPAAPLAAPRRGRRAGFATAISRGCAGRVCNNCHEAIQQTYNVHIGCANAIFLAAVAKQHLRGQCPAVYIPENIEAGAFRVVVPCLVLWAFSGRGSVW